LITLPLSRSYGYSGCSDDTMATSLRGTSDCVLVVSRNEAIRGSAIHFPEYHITRQHIWRSFA
jgi:hypothetical protein